MVMVEEPKPRDTFILIRGQYDKKGEKVEATLPACFPPMPARRADESPWPGQVDR